MICFNTLPIEMNGQPTALLIIIIVVVASQNVANPEVKINFER
jgi:hypothetical protein